MAIVVFLVLCFLLTGLVCFAGTVYAESDTAAEDDSVEAELAGAKLVATDIDDCCVEWWFYSNGTLVINGDAITGEYRMEKRGWDKYKNSVKKLVFKEDVSVIRNGYFRKLPNLKKVVTQTSHTKRCAEP